MSCQGVNLNNSCTPNTVHTYTHMHMHSGSTYMHRLSDTMRNTYARPDL